MPGAVPGGDPGDEGEGVVCEDVELLIECATLHGGGWKEGEAMEIREGFLRTELGGRTYVLPYGQNIADRCDGISLNETGEILWQGIESGCGSGELVRRLRQAYGLTEEMDGRLSEDVEGFRRYLSEMGMLQEEGEEYGWNPLYFSAGPLKVAYRGPENVYQSYFQQFACEEGNDLTVQIACMPPRHRINGRVILRNGEVVLIDGGEVYVFLFPGFPVLEEMHVRKDGSHALLFCEYDLIDRDAEDIFHAIRFAVLVAASERGLFFLHSASLLYRGRAWLFSGRSGAGKSTHTNLWREAYGVELLNGDLNMLGIEKGVVVAYGQPWCGTSGISTEKAYPLGGIIFLRQSPGNLCEIPDTPEKILAIVQRMISPAWGEDLLRRNIAFAERLERCCPVWRLSCRPDRGAAEVMKSAVDASLDMGTPS